MCGEYGIDGIVLGLLHPDGSIDVERTARLVESAYPMSVTFHRAFDMCSNPLKGLEDVILTGAARLLTSGQKNKAEEGLDLLTMLVQMADERITIIPGSGIDISNIEKIAKISGAKEFHLTGSKVIESEMTFRRESIILGIVPGLPQFSRKVADPMKIKSIIKVLQQI
jgi:copper homeostasis protein